MSTRTTSTSSKTGVVCGYFDFSGYSDMAIGLGQLFGFHFLENFNEPYRSGSVTEFWRRWHISLSSWFRDYVYIPLGGSRTSRAKHIRNLLIVWALTGIWHGASWNFLLWGLYYFTLLLLEKYVYGKALARLPRFVRWLYTFLLINLGWVIFRFTSLKEILLEFKHLFTWTPTEPLTLFLQNSDLILPLIFGVLGLFFCLPPGLRWKKLQLSEPVKNILALLLFGLSMVFLLSSSFHPFIYFRF